MTSEPCATKLFNIGFRRSHTFMFSHIIGEILISVKFACLNHGCLSTSVAVGRCCSGFISIHFISDTASGVRWRHSLA